MDAAVIRQALEEKYLAPTRRERPLYSGIEVEMPILNLKRKLWILTLSTKPPGGLWISAGLCQRFGTTRAR